MSNARNTYCQTLYKQIKDSTLNAVPSPEAFSVADCDIKLEGECIALTEELSKVIAAYRASDFNYTQEVNGKKTLIKFHSDKTTDAKLNPIQQYEAYVQALRYLRGVLLIVENTPDKHKFKETVAEILLHFNNFNKTSPDKVGAKDVKQLMQHFANTLEDKLGIKKKYAYKQLTMARDLGILLEDHPAITTVCETANQVTIETSTPNKVSETYYDTIVYGADGLENQYWLNSALHFAGIKSDSATNWLTMFFDSNKDLLKEKGVPAPPSARWLPIPGNNQLVQTSVAERESGITAENHSFATNQFMRTGVIIPFNIKGYKKHTKPYEEQKRIAKEIIKELIRSKAKSHHDTFKERYGDLADNQDFYISYQTLLSPLHLERPFGHVDNNSRFVSFVKSVVDEVKNDAAFIQSLNIPKLNVTHTNTAVNRNAWISNEYSDDDKTRSHKIETFNRLKTHILTNVLKRDVATLAEVKDFLINHYHDNPQLAKELLLREKACQAMQDLLDNKPPFSKMERYQRNITLSALESVATGSQGYTIAGCKSARDRTCIYACAIKAMKENPEAMRNWDLLERGIVKALKQGHGFRSMIFHSAIVKVKLVHKRFLAKLSRQTQQNIISLLPFSKIMKEEEVTDLSDKHALTHDEHADALTPPGYDTNSLSALTKEHAEAIATALSNTDADTRQTFSEELSRQLASFTTEANTFDTPDSLSSYLHNLRELQLNTKSYLINVEGEVIRIYPDKGKQNLDTGPTDMLLSGFDLARGALTILEHSNIESDTALNEIKIALTIFKENIANIKPGKITNDNARLTALQQAGSEYRKLSAVFSDILTRAGIYPSSKEAIHGITEARDFLWVLDRTEAVVTRRKNAISYAKRITFNATDLSNGAYKDQVWFDSFSHHHPWAEQFIDANPAILNKSPTPMQRSTPNPANAWDEATILLNADNTVKRIYTGVRMGISSPFQVNDKAERQRLTTRNHLLMATDNRLAEYANKHLQNWATLLPQGTLEIPILHQTLIDPGNLRYAGNKTGANPIDMLQQKRVANEALQEYLDTKEIYYDPATRQIMIDPDDTSDLTKIHFIVKDTNNGVNIHEKMTKKAPQDITHARDLILMARNKLKLFADKAGGMPNAQAHAKTIIAYLESSTPANPRRMTTKELNALAKLTSAIKDTHNNLALLAHASANLASFLKNDLSTTVMETMKDGRALISGKYKPKDMNDATYKSCYERIIAELLGTRMGGCKSAIDREQEIAELTNGMKYQFSQHNHIIQYHATAREKKAFISNFVNTQHKHNMCEMITANAGSSDIETQGQAYHAESEYERKASDYLQRVSRHPRVKKELSYIEYLKLNERRMLDSINSKHNTSYSSNALKHYVAATNHLLEQSKQLALQEPNPQLASVLRDDIIIVHSSLEKLQAALPTISDTIAKALKDLEDATSYLDNPENCKRIFYTQHDALEVPVLQFDDNLNFSVDHSKMVKAQVIPSNLSRDKIHAVASHYLNGKPSKQASTDSIKVATGDICTNTTEGNFSSKTTRVIRNEIETKPATKKSEAEVTSLAIIEERDPDTKSSYQYIYSNPGEINKINQAKDKHVWKLAMDLLNNAKAAPGGGNPIRLTRDIPYKLRAAIVALCKLDKKADIKCLGGQTTNVTKLAKLYAREIPSKWPKYAEKLFGMGVEGKTARQTEKLATKTGTRLRAKRS